MAFDVPVSPVQESHLECGTSKATPFGRAPKAAIAVLRSLTIEQLVLNRAPGAGHLSTRCIPTFNIVKALDAP